MKHGGEIPRDSRGGRGSDIERCGTTSQRKLGARGVDMHLAKETAFIIFASVRPALPNPPSHPAILRFHDRGVMDVCGLRIMAGWGLINES